MKVNLSALYRDKNDDELWSDFDMILTKYAIMSVAVKTGVGVTRTDPIEGFSIATGLAVPFLYKCGYRVNHEAITVAYAEQVSPLHMMVLGEGKIPPMFPTISALMAKIDPDGKCRITPKLDPRRN